MSNFNGYPTRSFSESQKFFVLDPQTGTPSFVLGSDLVNFLTPGTSFVFSESTRVSAQASNYKVGNLIQTAGAVTEGDGLASGFLVVPGGEGDFAMQNGNDLLVIRGDDLLREQLKEGVVRMPDLAAMESTNGRFDGDAARLVSGTGRDGDFRWSSSDLSSTLVLASATSDSVDDTTDTINDADHPFSDGDGVITQTTVNGLTAQTVYWVVNSTAGTYQLSATFGGGAIDLTGTSNFTVDHLSDPSQGVYVTPATDKTGASGAWVRAKVAGEYLASHFIDDENDDIALGINRAFALSIAEDDNGVCVYVPNRPNGGYWNWGTQVQWNVKNGSWINLEAVGRVPVRASAAIDSFVHIGFPEKADHCQLIGFSFDAYDQNIDAAVKVDRNRGSQIRDIELKASAGGSFVDGVRIDDGGAGSGSEASLIQNIIDAGDSSVTRSVVRFQSTSYGVTVDNVRSTQVNYQSIISSSAPALVGCVIKNLFSVVSSGEVSTSTVIPAAVSLSGQLVENVIENITQNDASGFVSFNNVVEFTSQTDSYGNVVKNIGGKFDNLLVSAPSGSYATQVNNLITLSGVPGISGDTERPLDPVKQDGLYNTEDNRAMWSKKEGQYYPYLDRRVFNLASNSTVTIPVPANAHNALGGLLALSVESSTGEFSGLVHWRTSALSGCAIIAGGASLSATTGPLSGAAASGQVVVSADSGTGSIYVQSGIASGRVSSILFL